MDRGFCGRSNSGHIYPLFFMLYCLNHKKNMYKLHLPVRYLYRYSRLFGTDLQI